MPRQGKDDISVALPGVASGSCSDSASASTGTLRAYRAGRDSPERERAREMFATHAKNRSALKSLRVRAATCVQQQEGKGEWGLRGALAVLSNNATNCQAAVAMKVASGHLNK